MNIVLDKSKKFAIKIYNLYKYPREEKHEYVFAERLLKSGTSIGANLTEARYSVSRKEFLFKASISLKECAKTEYWLDPLKETNLLSQTEYDNILEDRKEHLRLLISITKTTKLIINEQLAISNVIVRNHIVKTHAKHTNNKITHCSLFIANSPLLIPHCSFLISPSGYLPRPSCRAADLFRISRNDRRIIPLPYRRGFSP